MRCKHCEQHADYQITLIEVNEAQTYGVCKDHAQMPEAQMDGLDILVALRCPNCGEPRARTDSPRRTRRLGSVFRSLTKCTACGYRV